MWSNHEPREEERGDNEGLEHSLPHALGGLLESSSELININPQHLAMTKTLQVIAIIATCAHTRFCGCQDQ